jgi:alpha-methylacyl-CoA racemase
VTGPLDGVRVLDCTRLLPGGYATLLLADLGADVVKIEQPGRGDYVRWTPPLLGEVSAAHLAFNRNKRSVTLNLKASQGRDLLCELVHHFDVLVESFRPGVMSRLGVGYDKLSSIKPELVYCAITGYGQNGPLAARAGHDVNYLGHAGVLSLIGAEDSPPIIPGVQIADLAGGGMCSVIAVLSALLRRQATGEGDYCDVSMTDGALSWLSIPAVSYLAGGDVPQRGVMPLSGAFPCYRIYAAADGHMTVGALEPQFWSALCETIGRADLAGDGFATGSRRDEVVQELEAVFSSRTRAEWMEVLGDRDVCVGPVNHLDEALADEQVKARSMVVESDVAGAGSLGHLGNPINLRRARGSVVKRSPPALGEHTDEVLSETGVDSSRIAELRASGVV